jgi:hypothetical protein
VVLTGGDRRIGGKYSQLEISTSDGISSPTKEQKVNRDFIEEEVVGSALVAFCSFVEMTVGASHLGAIPTKATLILLPSHLVVSVARRS